MLKSWNKARPHTLRPFPVSGPALQRHAPYMRNFRLDPMRKTRFLTVPRASCLPLASEHRCKNVRSPAAVYPACWASAVPASNTQTSANAAAVPTRWPRRSSWSGALHWPKGHKSFLLSYSAIKSIASSRACARLARSSACPRIPWRSTSRQTAIFPLSTVEI